MTPFQLCLNILPKVKECKFEREDFTLQALVEFVAKRQGLSIFKNVQALQALAEARTERKGLQVGEEAHTL